MMRIWIARHGQVLPPKSLGSGLEGGQLYLGDPPLTALGEVQARALGHYAQQLGFRGLVLASPYHRTLSTAQHCAEAAGLGVLVCAELREMVGAHGLAADFSGLNLEQARDICPRLLPEASLPWPWWSTQRESRPEIAARLDQALVRHGAAGQDLLLITHGGPMNTATKAWLDRAAEPSPPWLDCWNTQVNRFRYEPSKDGSSDVWHCEALADTGHLSGPQQHTCNDLDHAAMMALRAKALAKNPSQP